MLNDTAKIQHEYIVGPTGSGKSYIAKRVAREIRMAGFPVFVASAKAERKNPDGSEKSDIREWKTISGAEYVTHDPMRLMSLWEKNQMPPACVVLDEGAIDLGNHPDPLARKFIKLCRDDHIKVLLLSQNYKRVSKDIRDNCGALRLFNVSSDEVRSVCADYRFDEASEEKIRSATNLAQYEYLRVNKALRVCEIINKKGQKR